MDPLCCAKCGATPVPPNETFCDACRETPGLSTTVDAMNLGTSSLPAVIGDSDATLQFSIRGADGGLRQPSSDRLNTATRTFHTDSEIANRYTIETELGRGGMGIVFRARDLRLDRVVALKVILMSAEGRPNNEALLRLFEAEAKIGASLIHPGIATVFDYGIHSQYPYIVFEYVEGESLNEIVRLKTRFTYEETKAFLGAVSAALDYAHSKQIVHRDLKPGNIIRTNLSQYKILDLGLAKRLSSSDWRYSGTPAYTAPEQASEQPADGRADQYSLAVVVYELLSGQRPFTDDNSISLLQRHQTEPPQPIESLTGGLPGNAGFAVMKALAKNPNDRFASCGEFAAAFGCTLPSERRHLAPTVKEFACIVVPGMPDFFVTVFPMWLMRFLLFAFRRLITVQIVLTDDALHTVQAGEVRIFSFSKIDDVQCVGRTLSIQLTADRVHHVQFSTKSDCEMIYADIREQISRGQASIGQDVTVSHPISQTVLLSPLRPREGLQLLGIVEARGMTHWEVDDKLKLQAARLGGDAVVDARREEIKGGFRWLSTGTAVKIASPEIESEIQAQALRSEVKSLGYRMLSLLVAMFMIYALLGCISAGLRGRPPSAVVQTWLAIYSWPLVAAGIVLWSKRPEFVAGAITAVLATTFVPAVGLLTQGCFVLVFKGPLSAAIWAYLALGNSILAFFFVVIGLGLWGNAKRVARFHQTINESQRVFWLQCLGGLTLACSIGFLIIYLSLSSWAHYVAGSQFMKWNSTPDSSSTSNPL